MMNSVLDSFPRFWKNIFRAFIYDQKMTKYDLYANKYDFMTVYIVTNKV